MCVSIVNHYYSFRVNNTQSTKMTGQRKNILFMTIMSRMAGEGRNQLQIDSIFEWLKVHYMKEFTLMQE